MPLWIAFILGRRIATRRYTYGFGRAEDLAGLFIVAVVALSAVVAAVESVNRLFHPQGLRNLWFVALAGVIGFAGNELVAIYRIRVGQRIGSPELVADGVHARLDGFTSLAVILGAAGVLVGFPLADPIVGIIISAAIIVLLWGTIKSIGRRLMDGIEPELVDRARHALEHTPGVLSVPRIQLRWVGHRLQGAATLVHRYDPGDCGAHRPRRRASRHPRPAEPRRNDPSHGHHHRARRRRVVGEPTQVRLIMLAAALVGVDAAVMSDSTRPPEVHEGEQHDGSLAARLNWLRAGVLGANDGIVSVAAIVVGVAGATSSTGTIATAGAAGLVGGAVSMALGEYVSVSSQRDSQQSLVDKERQELRDDPETELEELIQLHQATGLSRETAEQVARELTAADALQAHLAIELNIDEDDVVSPWHAAGASALAFTIGAILPLLAILLPPSGLRVPVTFAAVLIALALTGAIGARIGGGSKRRATLRVVLGGALALAATFVIGMFLHTGGVA